MNKRKEYGGLNVAGHRFRHLALSTEAFFQHGGGDARGWMHGDTNFKGAAASGLSALFPILW